MISGLRCSVRGRGCKGGRMRTMGSGWIDEGEKCFGRSCLAKVKRITREKQNYVPTDDCKSGNYDDGFSS